MNNAPNDRITKHAAAQRQLGTAIRLFFAGGDPVSVHSLTGAAHEILRSLSKIEGEGSFIKDSGFIQEGRREEFVRLVNEAQNFFKHANRDPEGILEFKSRQTESLLLDAICMDERLTGGLMPAGAVFVVWFALTYPNLLSLPQLPDLVQRFGVLHAEDRDIFLNLVEHPAVSPQS